LLCIELHVNLGRGRIFASGSAGGARVRRAAGRGIGRVGRRGWRVARLFRRNMRRHVGRCGGVGGERIRRRSWRIVRLLQGRARRRVGRGVEGNRLRNRRVARQLTRPTVPRLIRRLLREPRRKLLRKLPRRLLRGLLWVRASAACHNRAERRRE